MCVCSINTHRRRGQGVPRVGTYGAVSGRVSMCVHTHSERPRGERPFTHMYTPPPTHPTFICLCAPKQNSKQDTHTAAGMKGVNNSHKTHTYRQCPVEAQQRTGFDLLRTSTGRLYTPICHDKLKLLRCLSTRGDTMKASSPQTMMKKYNRQKQ